MADTCLIQKGDCIITIHRDTIPQTNATIRWEEKSLQCQLLEVLKRVALGALLLVGVSFAIAAGLVPLLIGSLVPHGVEAPWWLLSAFSGTALLGVGICIAEELIRRTLSDWTNYGDEKLARQLVNEFHNCLQDPDEKNRLVAICEVFASRFEILEDWGFLSRIHVDILRKDWENWQKLEEQERKKEDVSVLKQKILNSYVATNPDNLLLAFERDLPFGQEKTVEESTTL